MSHKPKKEDEIPVALALFEPPDPTKKPMYCKHLVYQGVTEFQFEELRAARYRQKVAREEVNQVIIMIHNYWLKCLNSEKATKFCEIFTLLLTTVAFS